MSRGESHSAVSNSKCLLRVKRRPQAPNATSGLPPTTDISRPARLVRLVPLPEVKSFTQSPRRQRPAGPARFPNCGGGRHGAYGRLVLTARNGTDGIFVRV
jgi:hypothetical protein